MEGTRNRGNRVGSRNLRIKGDRRARNTPQRQARQKVVRNFKKTWKNEAKFSKKYLKIVKKEVNGIWQYYYLE